MAAGHEHGGNVFAVARGLGIAPEEIVDFSASINPLGMAPGVPAAIAGCMERLLHYPDKGAAELKAALAAYHGFSSGEIAVANGSTELIHLVPRLVGGRRALIVAPAFAEYAEALLRAGWEVDYLVLEAADNFALPLSRLEERLSAGYDCLFVCNPGNPTGVLLPRDSVERVIALCRASGTFLVLDEAFIDFCEEQSAKHLVRREPRAILLRSMTKFFAIPGLRLGYAIAAPETIESVAALQDPWNVNTAAQVAGIASLADAEYCRRTRAYVDSERERFAAALAAIPAGTGSERCLSPLGLQVYPARANYLLARILVPGLTAGELRGRLVRKGILIRDCGNFAGLDGSFFRVAVRLAEQNDALIAALAEELR